MDNDEPFDLTGCNVYLRIAKADGTQFQGHECCIIDSSSIVVDTSAGNGKQILAAPGINKCELHIENENGIGITTWNFNIYVEARVHNGENISSINSYDVLDNIIDMEKDRVESEKIRQANETKRIINENNRIENEEQRTENEANRTDIFNQKIGETNATITDCQLMIDTANQKINNFDEEINEIIDGITDEAQTYANNASVSEKNAHDSSLVAESWAHGNTGVRADENTNNSEFWCYQSESHKNTAEILLNDATGILQDINEKIIRLNQKLADTKFEISDDGELELEYESDSFDFEINDDGELEYWITQEEI